MRQNGTYWYHSHTGLQEQLGHYGQLILEPSGHDPVEYDVEYSIILSDWTFEEPHRVLWKLKTMEGYYNFQRPTLANIDDQMKATGMTLGEVIKKRLRWDRMRMDPTDIADITGATYIFLMNGRAAHENPTFLARAGQRVRLRIVNASTMTFYDIRIPGLPMTGVQADGQNVKPVETDELRIAVAETYDVVVTLPDDRSSRSSSISSIVSPPAIHPTIRAGKPRSGSEATSTGSGGKTRARRYSTARTKERWKPTCSTRA